MYKFAPAGDSDFDSDEDEYDFDDHVDLPSLNADISDVNISRMKTMHVKPNCYIDESAKVLLLSDLQNAVINGNVHSVKDIIEKNSELSNTLFDSGWTPLVYACNFGNADVVLFLIEVGADVNLCGPDGCSPLMAVCKCSKTDGISDIINFLVENGANTLDIDKNGKTALMYAVRSGNEVAAASILKYNSNMMNLKDNKGWTALDWAISKTFESIIRLLIQNGATVFNNDPDHISFLSEDIKTSLNNIFPLNGNCEDEHLNSSNIVVNSSIHTDHKFDESESNFVKENGAEVTANGILIHKDVPCEADVSCKNRPEEVKQVQEKTPESRSNFWDLIAATNEDEDSAITINKGVIADCYQKYGQLELLLCGLSLTHLIPKFHEHDFQFEQLLCASADDLIAIGIKQVGSRNRILTAIKDWHSSDWREASLPNFSSTALTFGNLQALLKTSSEHLLYISSGLRYARVQLETYPQVLLPPASVQLEDNPDELVIAQVEKLVQTTHQLCQSLKLLHIETLAIKEKNCKDYKQVDCIQTVKPASNLKSQVGVILLPVFASLLFCVIKFKLGVI